MYKLVNTVRFILLNMPQIIYASSLSSYREERGERREERGNSEKERKNDRDSNPRPHPRSKIDALDRSATVGRRVMLLMDGWMDGLMDEGGKSGYTSNSKNLISFPVESLIYGRNSNLVYWTA